MVDCVQREEVQQTSPRQKDATNSNEVSMLRQYNVQVLYFALLSPSITLNLVTYNMWLDFAARLLKLERWVM